MASFYLGLAILLTAFVLFFISGRQIHSAGLPGGRVVYSDTRSWGPVEKPLIDPQLGLTGKPDYLVEQNGKLIPVEVKTGRTPEAPYDSHIFQVAVYCFLVQKTCGKRPPYGIIHYPNRTFAIDFTSTLEDSTKEIILQMQGRMIHPQVSRSHENPHCCKRCGYRSICDQSLRI